MWKGCGRIGLLTKKCLIQPTLRAMEKPKTSTATLKANGGNDWITVKFPRRAKRKARVTQPLRQNHTGALASRTKSGTFSPEIGKFSILGNYREGDTRAETLTSELIWVQMSLLIWVQIGLINKV